MLAFVLQVSGYPFPSRHVFALARQRATQAFAPSAMNLANNKK
jgi:hypothetical protein